MENIYKYLQKAKTDPQVALTEFDKWTNKHIDWLAHSNECNISNYTDVSTPYDNFYSCYEYAKDLIQEEFDLSQDTIDAVEEELSALKLYNKYNQKKWIWLAGSGNNIHKATPAEATKLIKLVAKRINHDNSHAHITPASEPLDFDEHKNQKLFCNLDPEQEKQFKSNEQNRQQEIINGKKRIKKIQAHLKKLGAKPDESNKKPNPRAVQPF